MTKLKPNSTYVLKWSNDKRKDNTGRDKMEGRG